MPRTRRKPKLTLANAPPEYVCRECGKTRYKNRGRAQRHARKLSRGRGLTPMKAYYSERCEAWHLTRAAS